jgi:hypothetical protein
MNVDLRSDLTAAAVDAITTAVTLRGEPLHPLCTAAAERLPDAPCRRIRLPALQPKQRVAALKYRKPGRLTSGARH